MTYICFSDAHSPWKAYLVWGAGGLALVGWARGTPMPRPEHTFADVADIDFGAQWRLDERDAAEVAECRSPTLAVAELGSGVVDVRWTGLTGVKKVGDRVVAFRSCL